MLGFQSRVFEVATVDGRHFKLLKPVVFLSKDGVSYTLPVGAPSDGASTPSALWPTLPPFGDYWIAAYFHDTAYQNTLLFTANGQRCALDKATCDDLLKEAMESLGIDPMTAGTIYEGVRIGGWSAFKEDRE